MWIQIRIPLFTLMRKYCRSESLFSLWCGSGSGLCSPSKKCEPLRPLIYRITKAPFWASTRLHCKRLRPSMAPIWASKNLLNFDFDADPDPAFDSDAGPDRAFHSDAEPDPTSYNDVDSCGTGSAALVVRTWWGGLNLDQLSQKYQITEGGSGVRRVSGIKQKLCTLVAG